MSVIKSLLTVTVYAVALATAQSWHQYVRAPPSRLVTPTAVLATHGDVSNADALVRGNGKTALRRETNNASVASVTLDFGQNIVGFTRISFAGASDNHPGIRLTFSETKQYLRNVSDFTRSDNGDKITPGTDQFAVPEEPKTWVNRHGCLFNGTEVCADGLHGFRYLRISLDALENDAPHTQPNGTVVIDRVELDFYGFLGQPHTYTGSFECSDPELTQWWYDAAYTNEMNTAVFTRNTSDPRDAFSASLDGKLVLQDGAKRDRDPYVGDVAVSGRTAYLTHLQTAHAAKNVLADLADHQRADGWIPPASISNYTLPLFDYPLWWVVSSWEYVLYTGDVDFAETYWAGLVAVLDTFYPGATNRSSDLLSKGLGGTDGYGDYAFLPRTGEVTYYNALYVYTLRMAASWAIELGHLALSQRWHARASIVSEAVNTRLWDTSAGAYLDSTNLTTSFNQTRHAQDGNGIAVLAGVATLDRANSALDYISNHMSYPYGNAFYDGPLPDVDNATERVYAFISFFELQARFLTPGCEESAIEEIKRLYGWMANHDPGITMWEGIGPGGGLYEQGYTSMAHGWSTGIVSLMSNYVLGVTPTEPGFRRWRLRPMAAGLSWARGTVRTPHGELQIDWEISSAGMFTMHFDAPEGTLGEVDVPVKEGSKVKIDGKRVQGKCVDGYMALERVAAGAHTVIVD